MAFSVTRSAFLFLKRSSLTEVKISSLISRDLSSNGVLPIPRSWLREEVQPKYHNKIEDVRPRWERNEADSRIIMESWQDIIKDVSDSMEFNAELKDRFIEIVDYNCINIMSICGYRDLLLRTYKLIATHGQQTDENNRLAQILGWCVQLYAGNFLIEDDVLDIGVLRGGKPTWYLKNNKDIISLKDGHLMRDTVYQLLKIHFSDKPYYVDLIDICHKIDYKTTIFLLLEKLGKNERDDRKQMNFDWFTMEKWAFFTPLRFAAGISPIEFAMVHTGIKDPEVWKRYNEIAKQIMKLIALTNDFVDCYGDPQKIGKSGTDISEGACSILIVLALKHATPEQKKILQENYGFDDPQKISRVYEVYDDMNIVSRYCEIEKECMDLINKMATQVSTQIPPEVFTDIIRADLFKA